MKKQILIFLSCALLVAFSVSCSANKTAAQYNEKSYNTKVYSYYVLRAKQQIETEWQAQYKELATSDKYIINAQQAVENIAKNKFAKYIFIEQQMRNGDFTVSDEKAEEIKNAAENEWNKEKEKILQNEITKKNYISGYINDEYLRLYKEDFLQKNQLTVSENDIHLYMDEYAIGMIYVEIPFTDDSGTLLSDNDVEKNRKVAAALLTMARETEYFTHESKKYNEILQEGCFSASQLSAIQQGTQLKFLDTNTKTPLVKKLLSLEMNICDVYETENSVYIMQRIPTFKCQRCLEEFKSFTLQKKQNDLFEKFINEQIKSEDIILHSEEIVLLINES